VGGTCGVLKTSFWPNIASAHPKNIRDFFFVARFSGSFMLLQLHAAAAAQVMKFVSPGIIRKTRVLGFYYLGVSDTPNYR
jgi:hypothetical protein